MLGTLAAGPLWPNAWSNDWNRPLALVLLVVGAFFGIAGAKVLGTQRTSFPEPKSGAVLVRHGVYRLVRHPLYTSLILLSFAWGLGWQSVPALVLALATTVFLDLKARQEERRLRQVFPDYPDYTRRVKRLIPWLY